MPIEKLREMFYVDDIGVVRHRVDRVAGQYVFKAGSVVGGYDSLGYQRAMIARHKVRCHHISFAISNGRWPSKFIDHINGNPSDNRPENLREVDVRTNCLNRKDVRSGERLPGTTFSEPRGKWIAQIYVNGVRKFLGHFSSAELAHAAYMEAYNAAQAA